MDTRASLGAHGDRNVSPILSTSPSPNPPADPNPRYTVVENPADSAGNVELLLGVNTERPEIVSRHGPESVSGLPEPVLTLPNRIAESISSRESAPGIIMRNKGLIMSLAQMGAMAGATVGLLYGISKLSEA